MRSHLGTFAQPDVPALLRKHERIEYNFYEDDIADLERRERDPNINVLAIKDCKAVPCVAGGNTGGQPLSIRVNPAVVRFMRERSEKLERARLKGALNGTVTFENGQYAPDEPAREVK